MILNAIIVVALVVVGWVGEWSAGTVRYAFVLFHNQAKTAVRIEFLVSLVAACNQGGMAGSLFDEPRLLEAFLA